MQIIVDIQIVTEDMTTFEDTNPTGTATSVE
jgi:hypothetical protein